MHEARRPDLSEAGATSADANDDAEPPHDAARAARVHVLIAEQPDGRCLVHPIVAPQLASYGRKRRARRASALSSRAPLARSSAEISRLSLPDGAVLRDVGVDASARRSPAAPPERGARRLLVRGDPARPGLSRAGDRWVIIPRLDHTFYVEEGEALDEAIRSEVRRLLGSQELTPWELLGFFPARSHRIAALDIPLEHRPRASAESSCARPSPRRPGASAPSRAWRWCRLRSTSKA